MTTTTVCTFTFWPRSLIQQANAANPIYNDKWLAANGIMSLDTGSPNSIEILDAGKLFGSDIVPFTDAFGISTPLVDLLIASGVIVQAVKTGATYQLVLTSDGSTILNTCTAAVARPLSVSYTTPGSMSDIARQLIEGTGFVVDAV